jgi:hypothetical protein
MKVTGKPHTKQIVGSRPLRRKIEGMRITQLQTDSPILEGIAPYQFPACPPASERDLPSKTLLHAEMRIRNRRPEWSPSYHY